MRWVPAIIYMVLLLPSSAMPPSAAPQFKNGIRPEQCLGGSPDAPIRIEVFSDFQCTHCRDFFLNTISKVLKEYCSVNKVCVVYREFPLPPNKHSRRAAQYSKAAQKLGREQWLAVITALYENQSAWSGDGSIGAVVSKALSPDDYSRLNDLLRGPEIDAEVAREFATGEKNKIVMTPTVFVHALGKEQRVSGILPYATLKTFFDNVLK